MQKSDAYALLDDFLQRIKVWLWRIFRRLHKFASELHAPDKRFLAQYTSTYSQLCHLSDHGPSPPAALLPGVPAALEQLRDEIRALGGGGVPAC